MNILFLESSIPPARGGIQRVSWIVSRYLNAHGHDSYFAFWFMDSEDVDDAHKLRIGVNGRIGKCETSLLDFVRQKNIHLIINQQAKGRHISNALKKNKNKWLV